MAAVSAVLLYMSVSTVMVLANKTMTYSYGFTATNVLLLAQMLVTLLALTLLRSLGTLSLEPITAENVRLVWPVTVFYVLNAGVSLLALRFLSLTAYSAIKRLTPLFILPLDWAVRRERLPASQAMSCAAIVGGTLLMAGFDGRSPLLGYVLGVASCACQAAYMVFVKRRGSATVRAMSSASILRLHSGIAIPLLLPVVLLSGEWMLAMRFPRWREPMFLAAITLWPLCGCLLNYALFLCTNVTSPMTASLAGHIKGAFLSVAGFFAFEGAPWSLPFLAGLGLNVGGSAVYVWQKYERLGDKPG